MRKIDAFSRVFTSRRHVREIIIWEVDIMAAKVYPEWVQKHRTQGMTVKKIGDNYYLYKHSSKRVPGKKNPVPKDSYIGRITPEGVVKSGTKKINAESSDVVVKEYGFSRAMETLCTQGWKDSLGKEWRAVLDRIILSESPESYITEIRNVNSELDPHIQFGAQKASFQRRMKKDSGVEISDLRLLLTVYIVTIGGKNVISRVSKEQAELLEKLDVKLEVD